MKLRLWLCLWAAAAPAALYAGVHDEGVYVSRDNGRPGARDGMQGTSVYRMRFARGTAMKLRLWLCLCAAAAPAALYAGVHDEGVYVSSDNGRTGARDGMQGTSVYRMRFVPGERP